MRLDLPSLAPSGRQRNHYIATYKSVHFQAVDETSTRRSESN